MITRNGIRNLEKITGSSRHGLRRFHKSNRQGNKYAKYAASSALQRDVVGLVKKYAQESQTSISLHHLLHFGNEGKNKNSIISTDERVLIKSAQFLRRELPIRLAHRIRDLELVPLMSEMPSIKEVKETYVDSFLELIDIPVGSISTVQDEHDFAVMLEKLYKKHQGVLIQMARGAFELRASTQSCRDQSVIFEELEGTHSFLDRFYTSRIGIRVLAGQYLSLRSPRILNWVGLVHQDTSPHDVVLCASEDARCICYRQYGFAPEVEISGCLELTFAYMPDHLHYILLELIKNSMRATVELHGDYDACPPIQVVIADGQANEDVVIKVSDCGGGITRSNMKKIWSYLFTTASSTVQEGALLPFADNGGEQDHGSHTPLAGMGFGLPISRSYARYFGGDLSIMSMEGHGTDAFVYLVRLGDTTEPSTVGLK